MSRYYIKTDSSSKCEVSCSPELGKTTEKQQRTSVLTHDGLVQLWQGQGTGGEWTGVIAACWSPWLCLQGLGQARQESSSLGL